MIFFFKSSPSILRMQPFLASSTYLVVALGYISAIVYFADLTGK